MKTLILGVILCLCKPILAQDSAEVAKLHSFITEWWRTPYRYGGVSTKGIDCSAFTKRLYRDVYNNSLPRTASEQYRATKRISKSQLQAGDLVFFRTATKSGWHVGVYITAGFFVHSGNARGVFINNLEEPRYKSTYYGAGRVLSKPEKVDTLELIL